MARRDVLALGWGGDCLGLAGLLVCFCLLCSCWLAGWLAGWGALAHPLCCLPACMCAPATVSPAAEHHTIHGGHGKHGVWGMGSTLVLQNKRRCVCLASTA
jgi:hypothetical protein